MTGNDERVAPCPAVKAIAPDIARFGVMCGQALEDVAGIDPDARKMAANAIGGVQRDSQMTYCRMRRWPRLDCDAGPEFRAGTAQTRWHTATD